ncbi:MAG TPA: PAS domain S-box protein, partial [Spirochaetota bacterium]|nr:PAS domain S-box protein [Spirochaetota bacterium]
MIRFRHLSIRMQILILAFIVAVPAITIIIYSGLYMRRTALASAELETERLAENISIEQHNLELAAQQLITVMAQLPEVKNRNRRNMTDILSSILKLNPQYSNLLIVDTKGNVWAHGLSVGTTFNAADRRYFINAMASGRISSGEFIRSRITSRPTFNLAYAFRNDRNEIDGVLVVAFALEYYRETLLRSGLPPDAWFMLLDHKGTVLYSTADPDKVIGTAYDPGQFREMRNGPDVKTDIRRNPVTGNKSILSYRKLWLPGEETPYLYIRVAVPVEKIISEADEMMLRNIIFFTLFLCAAISIAWFIGKRSIADRITLLEKASRKMADGDLNVNISGMEYGGEIGNLGRTFGYMAEKLKAREIALVESERNYRTIFNTNKDALFLHDAATGKIIEVNNSVPEMFGYAREEIIGRDVSDLSSGEQSYSAKEANAFIKNTVTEGPRSFEWHARRKDGTLFWAEVILSAATLNETDCVIAAVRDISDRKDAEEERKKLQAQLYHVQKMESIGQLAGGIAHDFNNILAAIMGYGSIMQQSMNPDDPNRGNIDGIMSSADRAAGLTQSLLAFSRKQVINPGVMEVNEQIRRVEKFLTRIIGEDVILTTDLSTEPLMIFADVTQMEQVLMNIAANARDAMPSGGRLMISTSSEYLGEDDVRTRGYGISGECAVISISDTGYGMDEETQKRIFDPFFTTKEMGRGTGLGLSIVYGIVSQNHGHISVYSEKGKGTTFRIFLPIVAAEKNNGEVLKPDTESIGGSETILLAEDNSTLREMSMSILRDFGYTVIPVEDGDHAVREFSANRDRIDLMILDIIMPQKNGKEVFEEARRIKPGIKVLFTSGYPADLIARQGVLE